MNLLRKLLIVFFILFPNSNLFGNTSTMTHVQTIAFDDGDQNQNHIIAGIEFNKDGTKLFTSSANKTNPGLILEYNLSTPYDISSRSYAGDGEKCIMAEVIKTVYDLEFNHDGTKLFVITRDATAGADKDKLFRYDLTTPYDISTCAFAQQTTNLDSSDNLNGSAAGDFSAVGDGYSGHSKIRLQGFDFNNDGTKLFLGWFGQNDNSAKLLEYTLSTPYDITSLQLVTTAGIDMGSLTTANVINIAGIRFSANGKRVFIISHQTGQKQGISQISLTAGFDTSSFVIDGKFNLSTATPQNLQPRGVAFNSSGLKLYIGNDQNHNAIDQIMEYDLACPFTIFPAKCPSITENKNRTGMAIAQIEIAKKTIDHSTDTALNRLKWIRRNKDRQNLTNLNLDINYTNQMLASLTKAVQVSAAKKEKKDQDQDIFYWSEGSIAVGRVGDTNNSSTIKIGTDAITLGADKYTSEKGMMGLAFRVGRNGVFGETGSKLDTDSYNLTYYQTTPIKGKKRYKDTIIGFGKLKSTILTVLDGRENIADRSGEQLYASFRIKDEISKDNLIIIPSGRFDLGHTVLEAYKESGAGGIDVKKQYVNTKKLRAGISAVQDISFDERTIKRHGKLEYIADIDRSSTFRYTYTGDDAVTFNEKLYSGALHNIKGEIGIDIVLPNSSSIFLIYERDQALDYGHTDKIHIAIGYLPNKETNFRFSIDGSDKLKSNYSLTKNINGFIIDFILSNNLLRPEDYDEAFINITRKF